jgi:hypothetical protein
MKFCPMALDTENKRISLMLSLKDHSDYIGDSMAKLQRSSTGTDLTRRSGYGYVGKLHDVPLRTSLLLFLGQ